MTDFEQQIGERTVSLLLPGFESECELGRVVKIGSAKGKIEFPGEAV